MLTLRELEDIFGFNTRDTQTKKHSVQNDKVPQRKKVLKIEILKSGCILFTGNFPNGLTVRLSNDEHIVPV